MYKLKLIVRHLSVCAILVSYNGRTRQFVILDSKGVSLWNKDALSENGSSFMHTLVL